MRISDWSSDVCSSDLAEALYADMGHFGRRPIRVSWVYFVLPALMINYLGQGAMIMSLPPLEKMEVIQNPFFYLASDAFRLPLVILRSEERRVGKECVSTCRSRW